VPEADILDCLLTKPNRIRHAGIFILTGIGLDPHREREARQRDQRGQGRRRMLASRLIGLFFSRYRVAGVIRSKQFYSKVYLSTLAQVQS
jgi:hypothetical protein